MYFTQFQDSDPYIKNVKMHHLIEFIQNDRLFYLCLPVADKGERPGVPGPYLIFRPN